MRHRPFAWTLGISCGIWLLAPAPPRAAQAPVTAIVGATVIDGTGAAPIRDAVIVVTDKRITAIGSREKVAVPAGARQIDAHGKWIIPGLIDTNVHLSLYGGQNERYESMVRYQPRFDDIVLEAAQIDLSYGITTRARQLRRAGAAHPRARSHRTRARRSGRASSRPATSSGGAGRTRFRSAGSPGCSRSFRSR